MKKRISFIACALIAGFSHAQSWDIQYTGSQSMYDCQFATATDGFVVGINSTVLKTTDAGLNWTPITIPNIANGSFFNSVYHYGSQPNFVIVSGAWDVMAKSIDGGATWTNATIPTWGTFFHDLDMASPTVGFAVGRSFGPVYPAIYKTTDGADSFFDLSANIPAGIIGEIRAVDFEGSNLAYFCGENGTILKTTDGGTTFTQIASGTTEHLTNIDIVWNEGWIVGENGTILNTSDAGATWTSVSNPYSIDGWSIYDVQILNPGEVYISGAMGIAHTLDNGLTWNLEYDATINGSSVYSIWIANMNGAWGTGTNKILVRNLNASIGENSENNSFEVYPNPTEDIVTISCSESTTFTITSIYGERVDQLQIDDQLNYSLAHLSSGMYIITNSSTGESERIIKN